MSLLNNVLLAIHVLCVIAILAMLTYKNMKAPHRLNPGVLHAAATALIAGISMVGIRYPLHDQNPEQYELFNNGKIAVKLLIVFAILGIGYANVKKPQISKNLWLLLILLTVTNVVIAYAL